MEVRICTPSDITPDYLLQLEEVFHGAYHNSYMYRDFLKMLEEPTDTCFFYFAIDEDKIVGTMSLQGNPHNKNIHIRKVAVSPKYRWSGVGTLLLNTLKTTAFEKLGLKKVYWHTNEVSGIKFYLKHGAIFDQNSIRTYNYRMSPENNLAFFEKIITDPWFLEHDFRLLGGDELEFWFEKD